MFHTDNIADLSYMTSHNVSPKLTLILKPINIRNKLEPICWKENITLSNMVEKMYELFRLPDNGSINVFEARKKYSVASTTYQCKLCF